MKSAPTIAFDYRPSRWVGMAAVVVCLAAGSAPWLSGVPVPVGIALSSAVVAYAGYTLLHFWNPRFRRIAYRASGWLLLDAQGTEHPAILQSHAHLGRLLTLCFNAGPRAAFRVVLTPDNLDADSRRRLILMLARAEIVQVQ